MKKITPWRLSGSKKVLKVIKEIFEHMTGGYQSAKDEEETEVGSVSYETQAIVFDVTPGEKEALKRIEEQASTRMKLERNLSNLMKEIEGLGTLKKQKALLSKMLEVFRKLKEGEAQVAEKAKNLYFGAIEVKQEAALSIEGLTDALGRLLLLLVTVQPELNSIILALDDLNISVTSKKTKEEVPLVETTIKKAESAKVQAAEAASGVINAAKKEAKRLQYVPTILILNLVSSIANLVLAMVKVTAARIALAAKELEALSQQNQQAAVETQM